ncbi:hypothetical protein BaRGS_00031235 [Batillaria attramentaria]|uniref:TLC domain-containing protein n=1 Tax=Batillaria attramentaria TaxID=370345 RepID=A0ABD0JSD5_9CAEN
MLTIGTLHVPSVLLSLCVWSCLYYLLRWLDPSRKAEWHCRIVTAVHATFITSLSAWAIFVHGPSPFTDAGGPNTSLQVKVTTICLGYFLFDFSWCIYFRLKV